MDMDMDMAEGPVFTSSGLKREGLVYDRDGNAYLPPTQRPDGSWRKAKRVKAGYIPQDEVPLYQSKGRLLAQQAPTRPAGAIYVDESLNYRLYDDVAPPMASTEADKPLTKSQKKNAKRKQKKEENKMNEVAFVVEEITESVDRLTVDSNPSKSASPTSDIHQCEPQEKLVDPSTEDRCRDLTKRIRALRKKIKQIEELESRIASGDIQKPDQDQLNKISKKEEFREELEDLMEEQLKEVST